MFTAYTTETGLFVPAGWEVYYRIENGLRVEKVRPPRLRDVTKEGK